jgi:hypothetical protein
LIQVLRRGASTRQGILDIVAANLGIVGEDEEVRRARSLIQIEEYLPEHTDFFLGTALYNVPFGIANPTLLAASPEVRITMLPNPDSQLGDRTLANVRIFDAATREEVRFPGRIRANDQLFFSGGSVLLNGMAPPVGIVGSVPAVPDKGAAWGFEADVVVPGAEAGTERELPIGRFDTVVGAGIGAFDSAVLAPADPPVKIEASSYKPNPGNFTVVIPWEIEGFTDKFDEQDHPRQQIGALVDRVKAAGVRAMVAYRIVFYEAHEMQAGLQFSLSGPLFNMEQQLEDAVRVDTRQAVREDHTLTDSLTISARFGYTRLGSRNGLG